jgi:RNA polymerase sigma-70 factor, ECF subfamily
LQLRPDLRHIGYVTAPDPVSSDFKSRRAADDRARLAATLVQAGKGDASAFEELYRRTSAKLFGVCLRIFADRTEAEDALQDAYITIWNKAATFDAARASPITWLAAVTRNRAIDRLRASGKGGLAPLDEASEVADPAPLVDARLLADADDRALTGCIETLEHRDADFIRSAFLRGATYADLAARDALPLGTVKSRIRRALMKLRECLEA